MQPNNISESSSSSPDDDSDRLLLLMSEYIVQATNPSSGQLMWNLSFTEFTNQNYFSETGELDFSQKEISDASVHL